MTVTAGGRKPEEWTEEKDELEPWQDKKEGIYETESNWWAKTQQIAASDPWREQQLQQLDKEEIETGDSETITDLN